MNQKVEQFLENAKTWKEEMTLLREIILTCNLKEEFKWKHPCYSLDRANVVLIHGFKKYCALLFFNGALMKDPKGLLIQQTENVQDRRQIRFKDLEEIKRLRLTLIDYIKEAMAIQQAGLKFEFKKVSDFKMPEEFQVKLKSDVHLEAAFNHLTPGRQKAYLLYFSSPKQSSTRKRRIDQWIPKILDGKGLKD